MWGSSPEPAKVGLSCREARAQPREPVPRSPGGSASLCGLCTIPASSDLQGSRAPRELTPSSALALVFFYVCWSEAALGKSKLRWVRGARPSGRRKGGSTLAGTGEGLGEC